MVETLLATSPAASMQDVVSNVSTREPVVSSYPRVLPRRQHETVSSVYASNTG
jgi:hypothetical protein